MINLFIDKNGGLNRNWKSLYNKHKDYVDSINLPYDTKTNLILTINGLSELPRCKICNTELPVTKLKSTYCSRKCSAADPEVKNKKLESTDIKTRSKKISKSLTGKSTKKSWESRKEKYGPTGFSKQGLKAIKNNGIKSKEKRISTLMDRYGIKNPFQLDSVKKSIKLNQSTNNSSRNHLPDWLYSKDIFSKVYKTKGIQGILKSGCSVNLANVLSCEYGLRKKYSSTGEVELINFIESLGVKCSKSRKIIPPYELDIYIPSKKLAIEFNGLYWHSSGSKETDHIKVNHLNKTELCESKGIQLLHIFENEWLSQVKQEIWKSVIKTKLGMSNRIYARKCKLVSVDYKTASEFCEKNHLQGHCNFSYAIGLEYKNELVQVATFGKARFKKNKTELIRLCSKLNTCVVGGASKLLKDKTFISYANRRWSYGNVYSVIGMIKTGVTPPCDYYIDSGSVYHRSSYMKHKLKDKLKDFDESLTAVENCYNNGIRRIWDSGNLVFEK